MGLLALLAACAGPRPEVVVVGGGPAGMAAAIEAAACATVTLYEGRATLGGSAGYGDAVTAVPTAEALVGFGGANSARTRFVERVRPDVLDWLSDMGVGWRELPAGPEPGVTLYEPTGGGMGVVAALEKELRARGVTVRASTRVDGLAPGWTVRAGAQDQPADAVVLATGGFAGDVERVRERLGLGPEVPLLRGAAPFADGNGLALATAVGGVEVTPGRAVLYAHGVPAPDDPTRALMLVDGLHVYPVDRDGTYLPAAQTPRGASGDVLRGLPGMVAWAILDDKALDHIPLWDGDRRAPVPALPAAGDRVADSPEALAARLGIDPQRIRDGVVARNRDARPDRPLLASSRRWAALPLRLTTAKTLTGLDIDLDGRVRDATGAPLPGLYAAGELAGFAHPWEERHLDSTMVSGAILTGRAAGRAVCADRPRRAAP